MKIKDIIELTDLSRESIRFYERCGLLEPKRNENGYREYNEEDVSTLKRIKLLRLLNISIEDIKEIQSNDKELIECLDKHLKQLEEQKINVMKSVQICNQLIKDKASYDNLNADNYLNSIDYNNIVEDVIKPFSSPWRRFFARLLDLTFYSFLVNVLLLTIFKINIVDTSFKIFLLKLFLQLVLLQFIEPFLLSKFGTTLGKFVLGLKVIDDSGNKLSFKKAFERTTYVIFYGLSLNIPYLRLVSLFICFKKCNNNEFLEWEQENTIIAKDDNDIRYLLYLVTFSIITLLSIENQKLINIIPNKGKLTIQEFIENTEFTQTLSEYSLDYRLTEEGEWKNSSNDIINNINYPKINFVLRNDELVEISYEVNLENIEEVCTYNHINAYLIMSYLKAQDSYKFYHDDAESIINEIERNKLEDFSYYTHNLYIHGDYLFDGYMQDGQTGVIYPFEENSFSYKFIIKK